MVGLCCLASLDVLDFLSRFEVDSQDDVRVRTFFGRFNVARYNSSSCASFKTFFSCQGFVVAMFDTYLLAGTRIRPKTKCCDFCSCRPKGTMGLSSMLLLPELSLEKKQGKNFVCFFPVQAEELPATTTSCTKTLRSSPLKSNRNAFLSPTTRQTTPLRQ